MKRYTSHRGMKSTAIVLFARSPEREALAKRMRSAAPLFGAVIASWLRSAEQCGAMPLIACAVEDRDALAAIAPEIDRGWIEQKDSSFGARVAAAAGEAFGRGFDAVMISAIDAPPPADLARAIEALSDGRPVVAPARDGGVNLIGLVAPDRGLLEQLTPRRRDLVRLCRARFHDLVVLRPATDLDSMSALEGARREATWRGFLTPAPLIRIPLVVRALRGVARPFGSRPPPAVA